jgi:hypothetical protein
MPDESRVYRPKTIKPGVGPVSALQGLDALNQIVAAARECITVHEIEKSKRASIRAHETTEVARIMAAESVLKDYFAQVFAERRSNFEELFTRLDNALEVRDGEAVHLMVRGIVDIAKSSPLADLGDLTKIRAALDDPDQVFEL